MGKKIYPDWVQEHKTKGTTIKKVGANYYLYRHTSKRVPGKKYPQPVDAYIGAITPDGVVKTGKKKLSLANVEVREYGFTKALWTLCPTGWKQPLGDDWEDILTIITVKCSANSYILKEREVKKEEEFHCQFPAQMASLNRRIHREHGVTIEELHCLDHIYLVYHEKEAIVSNVNGEQQRFLERISVSLEVV